MTDKAEINAESAGSPRLGEEMNATELDLWFVREVLPLEATLLQYLHHHWRDQSEVADLCQDVYVRVYERAREELPDPVRPFVFAVARNLLIDRLRHEQVIPIEAVSDVDALGVAMDEASPDRTVMARDALRRVMDALERLPPRSRDVVVARQLDGLSRRQIAERMGISEETVKWHLATGMNALADLFYGGSGEPRRRK
jgi:RNA polymerase sigma-70 factor (ECF subfamily)